MTSLSRRGVVPLASTACLLLAACTVGPDYKGPPKMVDDSQSFARAGTVSTTATPAQAAWWTALHDPELDALEKAALAANPDLAVAAAKLRESRAQVQAQQAQLLPTTSGSAIDLHSHSDGGGMLGGLIGGDSDLYDVGFDATWELDLFGGQRRAAESAAATAEADKANLADTQVSLTADVARAYVSLRDVQHRTALVQSSVTLQTQMLDLTRQRQVAGTASDLDVEQLTGQVEQTQAELVPLKAQIDEQLDSLAILTGRLPGDLDAELAAPMPVPLPPATVAVGDPATLIRHRPDIRAAERQIAAANAGIGQHIADYFPKLELLGDLGFSSTDAGRLFTSGSFSTLAAPFLSWKPFDFGRTAAAVEQARAGLDEATAQYRGTVLKALNDAETALSRYGHQRQDVAGLTRVMASDQRAATLSRSRYAGGTATLVQALDAERQRVEAEQNLAQSEAELTQDFIALQKSLGLGWQQP